MDNYGERQVECILQDLGVQVVSETDTNLLCLCVFHTNLNTPSLSVDKASGLYLCFSCDARGNLFKLVSEIAQVNVYGARRLIEKHNRPLGDLAEYVDFAMSKVEMPEFDKSVADKLAREFWNSPGHEYLNNRGFTDKTLEYFKIGYSYLQDKITIPMHNDEEKLIGLIGRSVVGKQFKNSKGLQTKQFLFNAHRARKTGETVIVCESALDVMRLHQVGCKNGVSTNGGFFTDNQARVLDMYFNRVILMTDFDDPAKHKNTPCRKCKSECRGHNPGRALGETIIKRVPNKIISWAAYDYGIVYPHGAKDPGEMTEEEIKQTVNNAVSASEYEFWKREFPELRLI